MSPESALGALAQRVAKVEQRVDDLATRALERVGEIAASLKDARAETNENFRVFGPVIQDHAALRRDIEHLTNALTDVKGSLRELRVDLEALEDNLERAESERQKIREAREEREREWDRVRKKEREERQATERRDKWARRIQTVAVALTFVSTSIAVAVFLVGQQRGR
jgi:chromosome segregation ATPase